MTYKEQYMACESFEEMKELVKNDIVTAWIIGNPDRLKAIQKAIKEVAEEKGW